MKAIVIVALVVILAQGIIGQPKDFQIPKVCGLETKLREKCVTNTEDQDCANCVVGNYLSKFCHELKPVEGVEPDCEKILSCVDPLDIQC